MNFQFKQFAYSKTAGETGKVIASTLVKFAISLVGLLASVIGVLASTDKSETSDRPLGEGSDLLGDYNFRTGRTDSGADPDGWYEDDM